MTSKTVRIADRLPRVFDRYQLPKFAFALVTTASLAGAVLTGMRHGWTDWPLLAVRWAALWSIALLLGAEVWKLFYLGPSLALRPVSPALEYGEAMVGLHRKWKTMLVPFALVLVTAHFVAYAVRPSTWPWALAGGAGLGLTLAGFAWSRLFPAPKLEKTGPWLGFTGLAVVLAAMAGLDVTLQPGNPWLLVPNRILHVWAFAAWLGGAFWNIFIAVPAGIVRVNMDTVILANFQLERFRVVVRTVFPVLIATGLVQAWAMFGWKWQALFHTVWGYLVLAKIGLILALVAVFILCPMWRACSPVRGVCDLDDLG